MTKTHISETDNATPGKARADGHILATVMFLLFALLYLSTRSLSLDDFDSVSFALALENFDLALQQPQPPGFPVYIALGRIMLALTSDPVVALTTLSAMSGTLGIVALFVLVRQLDSQHPGAALIAALSYGLLPVTWLSSAKALSDIPGIASVLIAMVLWLWAEHGSKPVFTKRRCIAAFISGIALGVRPQNALPLAVLVIGLLIRMLVKRTWHRSWLFGILAGTAGILVWLVPVSMSSGGLQAYIGYIQAHAEHVGRADSLFGLLQNGMTWTGAFNARFTALRDTLSLSLTGIDPYSARTAEQWAIIIALALFGLTGLILAPWKKRWLQAISIWLIGMCIQSLLTITLDRPRLLLPLMPPLCILVAAGWAQLCQRGDCLRFITVLATVIILGTLLISGWPLAELLATQPTPPIQALNYIAENWTSDQTLIVTAGSFRHAQYTLPEYPVAYLYQFDGEAVSQMLSGSDIRTIAILDRDQIPSDIIDLLRQDDAFVTLEDTLFKRDRAIHTQHDQVRLTVLVRADDIPLSALVLPENGCIDIGSDQDGTYLGAGWYRSESVSGTSARWAGGVLTSTVRFTMDTQPQTLILNTRAMSYHIPQNADVLLNGESVGHVELEMDWSTFTVDLPVALIRTDVVNVLELVHSEINTPYSVTNGSSADQRHLTAVWDSICLGSD